MPRRHIPRIAVLVVIIAVLTLNAALFGNALLSWISSRTTGILAPAAALAGRAKELTRTFLDRADLAVRVTDLEAELDRVRADAVQLEEARREAAFYRAAAGVSPEASVLPVAANLFSYLAAPGTYRAVLNRGASDGVSVGDVVVTEAYSFIGVVSQVAEHHGIVLRLQDTAFEVTARVGGTDVTGLIRGDGDGSLLLDLVRKDEVVAEGVTVVTSGDDRYPAGLTLGSVRTVNRDAATLFQLIRVDPEVPALAHGRVIILRP